MFLKLCSLNNNIKNQQLWIILRSKVTSDLCRKLNRTVFLSEIWAVLMIKIFFHPSTQRKGTRRAWEADSAVLPGQRGSTMTGSFALSLLEDEFSRTWSFLNFSFHLKFFYCSQGQVKYFWRMYLCQEDRRNHLLWSLSVCLEGQSPSKDGARLCLCLNCISYTEASPQAKWRLSLTQCVLSLPGSLC